MKIYTKYTQTRHCNFAVWDIKHANLFGKMFYMIIKSYMLMNMRQWSKRTHAIDTIIVPCVWWPRCSLEMKWAHGFCMKHFCMNWLTLLSPNMFLIFPISDLWVMFVLVILIYLGFFYHHGLVLRALDPTSTIFQILQCHEQVSHSTWLLPGCNIWSNPCHRKKVMGWGEQTL